MEIYDFNDYNCCPKKVYLTRWSLLGSFCPNYIDILIQSVFSPKRVSQKIENTMTWAKSPSLRTPCMVKMHFEKYIYFFGTNASQKAQPNK